MTSQEVDLKTALEGARCQIELAMPWVVSARVPGMKPALWVRLGEEAPSTVTIDDCSIINDDNNVQPSQKEKEKEALPQPSAVTTPCLLLTVESLIYAPAHDAAMRARILVCLENLKEPDLVTWTITKAERERSNGSSKAPESGGLEVRYRHVLRQINQPSLLEAIRAAVLLVSRALPLLQAARCESREHALSCERHEHAQPYKDQESQDENAED